MPDMIPASMKFCRTCLSGLAVALSFFIVPSALGQSSNTTASTAVYVPDYSHSTDPLPNGILAWDALEKTVEATNGQGLARYTFSFTNISSHPVTIIGGSGSCSCTTVILPPTPWIIPAGGTGKFDVTIDLAGKSGGLIKGVNIVTDRGTKQLLARANIPLFSLTDLTDAQKMAGIAAAKADRQAVFQGDCAACHAPKYAQSLYGPQLFHVVCAVCHEAEHRATMVPDLGSLKTPTNVEFWRTWITYGKPGTLMPAFATSQGGPLTDLQISSLAAFLDNYHPSNVTNPPTH